MVKEKQLSELEAVKTSIAHWERMYENMWWIHDSGKAKTLFIDYTDRDRRLKFLAWTNETWNSDYCGLCWEHSMGTNTSPFTGELHISAVCCGECIIEKVHIRCENPRSIWRSLVYARDIFKWFKAAKEMIKLLYECKEEIENGIKS